MGRGRSETSKPGLPMRTPMTCHDPDGSTRVVYITTKLAHDTEGLVFRAEDGSLYAPRTGALGVVPFEEPPTP
jgi:hypothetical protein